MLGILRLNSTNRHNSITCVEHPIALLTSLLSRVVNGYVMSISLLIMIMCCTNLQNCRIYFTFKPFICIYFKCTDLRLKALKFSGGRDSARTPLGELMTLLETS